MEMQSFHRVWADRPELYRDFVSPQNFYKDNFFKVVEYKSFRKVLKALKSLSGGLYNVDRMVLFEFFDINPFDRHFSFICVSVSISSRLKRSESRLYMLMLSPSSFDHFCEKHSYVDE